MCARPEDRARDSALTYPVVESFEASGREANRSCSGKVQVAAVKEIEERILQHLGPHLQILEVGSSFLQMHQQIGQVYLEGEQ